LKIRARLVLNLYGFGEAIQFAKLSQGGVHFEASDSPCRCNHALWGVNR
jgi:hypothetical protein